MSTTGWTALHTPTGLRLNMDAAVPALRAALDVTDPQEARRRLGINPYDEAALVAMVRRLGGEPLLDTGGNLRRDSRDGIPHLVAQGGSVGEWAAGRLGPWETARRIASSLGGCIGSARKHDGFLVPDVALTVTGRATLSGAPIHGIPGSERHMLLPERAGWAVAQIDYSAFDWAVTAALCGDPQLVADCDVDPLAALAAELRCDRDGAKRVSYGLAYGAGVKLTAAQLGCSVEDATRLREAVAARWPGWGEWRQRLLVAGRADRSVRTADGRVLPLARPGEDATAGGHRAIPYAVQGTGAGVMADRLLALRAAGIGWALTWHDAVYIAGPAGEIEERAAAAAEILTQAPAWLPDLRLRAAVSIADTFAAGSH